MQIFESWLGELEREDLEEFSFPYLARIAEAVRKAGVPGHLLRHRHGRRTSSAIAELGYDVVSVDWRIPHRGGARARLPGRGHAGEPRLDPAARAEGVAVERARADLRGGRPEPGYIFNLGHGIQPPTPPENVKAVVDAVHAFHRGSEARV